MGGDDPLLLECVEVLWIIRRQQFTALSVRPELEIVVLDPLNLALRLVEQPNVDPSNDQRLGSGFGDLGESITERTRADGVAPRKLR
jgi:hypothetical protein